MINLFLSYSRANSTAMRSILGNLRELGFNVWVDIDGLSPGTTEWEEAIDQGLNAVDGVIVLLSPEAKRSTWVNNEIRTALLLNKPIFPVLLDGDEIASIPIGLRNVIYTDMRSEQTNFDILIRELSNQFDYRLPKYELEEAKRGQIPHVHIDPDPDYVQGSMVSIGGIDDHVKRRFPVGGLVAVLVAIAVIVVLGLLISRPDEESPQIGENPTQTQESAQPSQPAGPTLMPTITPTSEFTPTPTLTPDPILVLAESGSITANEDWTPFSRTIDGVEMALVPVGCFEMGSIDTEESNESPVHEVCFVEPFWLDVYEVTNAQYGSAGFYEGDTRPRDSVTWEEANSHCIGRGARLPTEAEWEYATRGPDENLYSWGNEWTKDNAVWLVNSGNESQAVGFRPADRSWVGVYDLMGNIREWINDWYDAEYYMVVPDGAVDPQGPFSGEQRVARGGSWFHGYPFQLRSTLRIAYFPDYTSTFTGFRCARDYP